MSVNFKMTAIADAIRAKTGKTGSLTLDQMATEIAGLSAAENISHANIPVYVKTEALRVANLVESVRKEDSIVFLAMSDSHHCGEQSNTGWQTNTNTGNLHAGMAAKILAYALKMDFACHLGDITFGHGTTTNALLHQQIAEMNSWLDEAFEGLPQFRTVGNHDTGMYGKDEGYAEMETNEYLFSVFGSYCEGAVFGSTTFGYCYKDFEDKKLRVICLNTSEGDSLSASYELSPAQLLWFAQAMRGVGSKANASEWSVLVLGHYPLDWPGMADATAIVKEYIDGSSVTHNGTTVNFSGANGAKFIANFHGHTHCFKYAKLNTLNTTAMTATEYNAWRVGIPNSSFYRNNHQEGPNAHGIYFEDEVTYDKTIGGAKDTAFVVNVITPSEEVIHSFCYGAGMDRVIGYGDIVYHKIVKYLYNATVDNSVSSIETGQPYTAKVIPNDHCAVSSVTIKMAGVDITASAYNDGVINIPAVTGDLVITVKAIIALGCTNQVPISTDDAGKIYGGDYDGDGVNDGYKTKSYINSAGGVGASDKCVTGYIPAKAGDVIRMKGMGLVSGDGNNRIAFYDANKTFIKFAQATSSWYMGEFKGVLENGVYTQFTLKALSDIPNYAYIRICCDTINAESILTVNEEIKYADEVENTYGVIYNLSGAGCSNSSAVVVENAGYTTTIIVSAGYVLDSVTVTMGGVNITSTAYNNGVISIPAVTGNVIITVTTIADSTVNYSNRLPLATDASGAVYNGKGYKEDTYISSGNEATKAGTFTSGFIPCKGGNTLYFKNVGMQSGQDGHRLAAYASDKSHLVLTKTNNSGFTGFTWGADGNISSVKIPTGNDWGNTAFIRFCCSYIGDDSIVTVNEPIE